MTIHLLGRLPILRNRFLTCLLVGVSILGLLSAGIRSAHSNPGPEAFQVLTGYLDPGEREVYHLPNLRRGNILYIYMQRLSGNLDPLFAVADGHFKTKVSDDRLDPKLQEPPHSPYNVFLDLLDSFYLAWNDDSGQGSDAALKFPIPANADYKVAVAGSRQPVGRQVMGQTFGGIRFST